MRMKGNAHMSICSADTGQKEWSRGRRRSRLKEERYQEGVRQNRNAPFMSLISAFKAGS